MGGFTLFEGDKPQRVLLPREMEGLLRKGKIDLPQITEEEIRDRSKGDGLSKIIVIGQTSWFVAQCIARRAQGLILTELELVTGAFAILNGVMYFLWWNKPLDVRCSVPVHILDTAYPEEKRFRFKSAEKFAITCWPWGAIFFPFSLIYYQALASLVTWISKFEDINLKTVWNGAIAIAIFPWNAVSAFYSRLTDIVYISSAEGTLEVSGSVSTVSTFHASLLYTSYTVDLLVLLVTSIIAMLFGGLHCVGWFFTFPSHAELVIWRVCSAVISIIPICILLAGISNLPPDKVNNGLTSVKTSRTSLAIFGISLSLLPIYAIARLLLLGEAFAALRYLPPDALAVVNWLSFLPHI